MELHTVWWWIDRHMNNKTFNPISLRLGISFNFCQKLFTLTRYVQVCIMFLKLRRCCCRQAWQGTANSIWSTLIFNCSKKFASIENNILCGNCVNLFFSFTHCVAHRFATRSSRKDEADKNNPWKRIKSWTERYFPSFSFFSVFAQYWVFSVCAYYLSLFIHNFLIELYR